jgi:peptide/nickel transport system ATP-binding protein
MTDDVGKKPLLNIKNLQVDLPIKQGRIQVVDQVSFSLDRGKTLGLVGESGCGKSMLAKAIMGLLPFKAQVSLDSKIEFMGQNLLRMSAAQIRQIIGRNIGLILQDPMTSLNPVMKIGSQVSEILRHHLGLNRTVARNRAVRLLDSVGIPIPEQCVTQYPHQLSGGLRQRVAIAIAIACKPQLLIADEPTTALDVTVQAEILDLLAELQQEEQMAMILITHDLGIVAGRTHETAVMYAGEIVEHAPTTKLFKKMRMPYTRALMRAIPHLADPPHTELKTINGQPPDLLNLPAGCRFSPRCPNSQTLCTKKRPDLECSNFGNHRFACWYPLNVEEG